MTSPEPEYALLTTILQQARRDLGHRKPDIRQDALDFWQDADQGLSLVCDLLGLDMAHVQQHLARHLPRGAQLRRPGRAAPGAE